MDELQRPELIHAHAEVFNKVFTQIFHQIQIK